MKLLSGSTRQSGIESTKRGHGLIQLWNNHEIDITRKTSNSYKVTTDDILRAASAAARKPSARLPDSKFLRALGTEDVYTAPHQTSALSLRAAEEWERCICENQAFSILHQAQEGRQELIKKDGGEMLVSIVLDRPLDEAEALVEDPDRLISGFSSVILADVTNVGDPRLVIPVHIAYATSSIGLFVLKSKKKGPTWETHDWPVVPYNASYALNGLSLPPPSPLLFWFPVGGGGLLFPCLVAVD